jgi:phosphate-selective porin OprO/OprP
MNAARYVVYGALATLVLTAANGQDDAADGIAANAEGFALLSGDGAWTLRLRALLQVDGRVFDSDSAGRGDNEWVLRRVRPTLEGSFGERVAFRLMPDFGNGRTEVPDAWIDLKLGEAGAVLRAGKFKPPVGLERLRSANHLQLVERSIVTELVPRRDLGVQLSAGGEQIEWAAGLFNGVVDGGAGDGDSDGKQELAARVFAQPFADAEEGPFSGLGLGVAVTYGSMDGTTANPLLPGYRSPGQKVMFDYRTGADGTFASGERRRVSPQFYWYRGPWGLMGELVRVSQDVRRVSAGVQRDASLDHDAWQLTLNWFPTGEAAGFQDPKAIGAIEVVARASGLSTDTESFVGEATSFADPMTAVRKADTRALGVNWYPAGGIKASLTYHETAFSGGSIGGDREDEHLLLARLQLFF